MIRRDHPGEAFRRVGQPGLGGRGTPAPDPFGSSSGPCLEVGRFEVVGEQRPPPLLADLEVAQEAVGLGEQRHPGRQTPPRIHDRVMVRVGLHLDQPAPDDDPRLAPPSGPVDGAQSLRGDVRPVGPGHTPAVAVANQQVQAGRATQIPPSPTRPSP
jgi:hypothetical protein